MKGGVTPKTQEQADEWTPLLYTEHPAPIVPGKHILLYTCISMEEQEIIEKETGRLCPRVDLLPRNKEAAALAWLLIQPPLAGALHAQTLAMSRTMGPKKFKRVVNTAIIATMMEEVQQALETSQQRARKVVKK